MKIQYLGHAGFIVNTGTKRILLDPFFHSAFLGSWFPYPENSHLEEEVLSQRFDYLYISHTHEDHFDVEFLKKFKQKNIKVFCPNYRSNVLARSFQKLGFENLIKLGHRESHLGEDFIATIYLDVSHKEDSGILIQNDKFRFLNLNDCNTKLSELPSDVTVLAAQYSGAMWYPNCYDYPPEVEQEKTDVVVDDLLKTLVKKIKTTKPKHYIPCAGPACFLDPELQRFNDRKKTIFPDWNMTAGKFAEACPEVGVIKLHPGGSVGNGEVLPGREVPVDIPDYSARRKSEWDVIGPAVVLTEEVEKYFKTLSQRNFYLLKEPKVFRLVSGDKTWTINLHPKEFWIKKGSHTDTGYEFTVPPFVLKQIIAGNTGWEEALLSMRIGLKRNPDVYDSTLFGLLRYGNEPTQTKQMIKDETSSELITREGHTFQRYCPHAGEDLSFAAIENGQVVCPRHHWKWDLKTGECLKGGNIKLKVDCCK